MPAQTKYHKLKTKLRSHRKRARASLVGKHQKAASWLTKKSLALPGAKDSVKFLTSAGLAGSLLLSSPAKAANIFPPRQIEEKVKLGFAKSEETSRLLATKIQPLVGDQPIGHLPKEIEIEICNRLKNILGVDICSELEGNKLNHSLGWIGYEQHLKRFPGDTLDQHHDELVAGVAPGLGAWGYFAESADKITEEEELREKYYFAVQTLYMPDFHLRSQEIYDWFKYRKMIVVNPENGRAVVAVVGDAGPAEWTGKQFGGSPEVMKNLDLHLGYRKGKVLLFFVKDPDNKIPLGPINYPVGVKEPILA